MPPAAFAAMLNQFYRVATDILVEQDAIIDKLIGDEVMGLFIPGLCGANYRASAARTAEALVLGMGHRQDARPWLPIGVGVHAGPAFVGKVGRGDVTDFTALGDTINTAARLQAEAADGEVILSDGVYESIEQLYPNLERHVLTLRGKEQPLVVRVLRPGFE